MEDWRVLARLPELGRSLGYVFQLWIIRPQSRSSTFGPRIGLSPRAIASMICASLVQSANGISPVETSCCRRRIDLVLQKPQLFPSCYPHEQLFRMHIRLQALKVRPCLLNCDLHPTVPATSILWFPVRWHSHRQYLARACSIQNPPAWRLLFRRLIYFPLR